MIWETKFGGILDIPVSSVNVESYICSDRCFHSLKGFEKLQEDPETLHRTEKNQGKFCHQSSPVSQKMLSWILKELKEYNWKTCGCGQHWRPVDVTFELEEICPETALSIYVGKQCYLLKNLTDFKKWFDVSFLTLICVNNFYDTELHFLNKLM